MKKLLGILVLGLLLSGNAYAQIFYPNKDIDLDKFFNFDISNYSFEDYEKILGKNSQKWDGDPDKKGRNELDYRKISIKFDGRKHELKLRKLKKGLKLYLTLNGYTCDEAQKLVPEKYIKKENYYNYYSDFVIMKMQSVDFSYDIGESRFSFGCMGMVNSSGEAEKVQDLLPRAIELAEKENREQLEKKTTPLNNYNNRGPKVRDRLALNIDYKPRLTAHKPFKGYDNIGSDYDDGSVEVDISKYSGGSVISEPRFESKVAESIWRLKNKK